MDYALKFEIIEQLMDFAFVTKGNICSDAYIRSGRKPSLSVIEDTFGSWENAIQSAGLSLSPPEEAETKSECLKSIQSFIRYCGDSLPTRDAYIQSGLSPKYSTIRKHYKTWGEALEAAGYDAIRKFCLKKYSKREMIKSLKKFYKKYAFITLKAYRESNFEPNVDTIINTFGSWNEALEQAGIPLNRRTFVENYGKILES